MDGQEYLNQISATSRPVQKTKNGILSSKFFWVGLIGAVGLILIVIIGSALSGGKGGEKNLSYALVLHVNNTAEEINEYQPSVKSSELRSSSASLYGVLTNTSSELTEYLTNKYGFKEKDVSKNIAEEAASAKDELENELFEAKINGILDRIYAHKMAYEIAMIMNEESKVYDATKNTDLKELIDRSYKSLENLYDKFNDFSETK